MGFMQLRINDIHGVIRYVPKTKSWDSSNRGDHIVGIQVKGTAKHDFGYKELTLTDNTVFFFNQYDDYIVDVQEPGMAFCIHFTTVNPVDMPSFCVKIADSSKIMSLLQKAEIARDTGDEFNLMALAYLVCNEVYRAKRKPYSARDARMIDAKHYIDLHFREDGCYEYAMMESCVGARRFSQLFNENFLITPHKYILFKKIEHAKGLLATGIMSVSEVADASGFDDVSYFSKVFKREVGLPPLRYASRYSNKNTNF